MKTIVIIVSVLLSTSFYNATGQSITYSAGETANNRNLSFEIIGKFSDKFIVFKNPNRRHEFTIYDNNMAVMQTVRADFISDRAVNVDFIAYPDYFLMFWQHDKGNTTRFHGAKINEDGQLVGSVLELDAFKTSLFSNRSSYGLTWSEDKKKILLYRIQERNDVYDLTTKIYDESLAVQDTAANIIDYNQRREYFSGLQVSNEGALVFTKVKHNARAEYINSLEIYSKRLKSDSLIKVSVPLEERLITEPFIKIDNVNNRYFINSFSYKKFAGNVEGIFTALIAAQPLTVTKKAINIFNDTLLPKLSGRPDWRTAFDNLNLRNVILKKDGGFMAVSEEYYTQRRFGNGFDDRFSAANYRYNDYFLYNRGNYGYYRPFNEGNSTGIVYNYNDIIAFSFSKDLKLEWNKVINKTTSAIENDNFLSFVNMNAGGEIHFLFLQKDNNRQIISDHGLQPDGSVKRYATLKGREAGYYFMPRLGRQTGQHQMIIPCIVRNNLAFAKIDF